MEVVAVAILLAIFTKGIVKVVDNLEIRMNPEFIKSNNAFMVVYNRLFKHGG